MDKVTDFASKNKNILYIVLAVVIVGFLIYWFYPRAPIMYAMPMLPPGQTAGYGMEEFRQGQQGSISSLGQSGQTEPIKVILFYSPRCPHCRHMMDGEDSAWEQLKRKYGRHPGLVLDQVNCDERPELATKFGAVRFPTIVKMKKDKIEKREGDQGVESLEEFIGSE